LLIGAGGAGSAIGLALLDAGLRELAIHDADASRRDALIGKLAQAHPGKVAIGSPDPSGFDSVSNATPAGMKEGDPLPIEIGKLAPSTFVSDVVHQARSAAADRGRAPARLPELDRHRDVRGRDSLMLNFWLETAR
jgi:shikimate dehydrogenase